MKVIENWTWSSKFNCLILDSLREEEKNIHSNHLDKVYFLVTALMTNLR